MKKAETSNKLSEMTFNAGNKPQSTSQKSIQITLKKPYLSSIKIQQPDRVYENLILNSAEADQRMNKEKVYRVQDDLLSQQIDRNVATSQHNKTQPLGGQLKTLEPDRSENKSVFLIKLKSGKILFQGHKARSNIHNESHQIQ